MADLLNQMSRKQLVATAKAEKIQHWRYPTKVALVAAIRAKRKTS